MVSVNLGRRFGWDWLEHQPKTAPMPHPHSSVRHPRHQPASSVWSAPPAAVSTTIEPLIFHPVMLKLVRVWRAGVCFVCPCVGVFGCKWRMKYSYYYVRSKFQISINLPTKRYGSIRQKLPLFFFLNLLRKNIVVEIGTK